MHGGRGSALPEAAPAALLPVVPVVPLTRDQAGALWDRLYPVTLGL